MLNTTVIIVAHKRKEFIKEAVESVLGNTQRPTEIIVVKNFSDPLIDSFLQTNKIITIDTSDESLGGKLSEGISYSSGDIIFFLEDDDLFSKEKIAHVTRMFNEYDIGFYHNAQLVFYDSHAITNIPNNRGIFYYYRSIESEKTLNYLIHKLKVGFNVSSIVISRNLAEKCKMLLKNVKITADTFLFFCAVENAFPIIVDLSRLTYYRIMKRRVTNSNLNAKLFEMQYNDALYFKTIFLKKILRNNIEMSIRQRELLYKIITNKIKRRDAVIYTIRSTMDFLGLPSKWTAFLIILSSASILSKNLSRYLFVKMAFSNSIIS